jgi:hypothetical protein
MRGQLLDQTRRDELCGILERNCTRDEGGPFEVSNQVLISSPPPAAVVKSDGGERCVKVS